MAYDRYDRSIKVGQSVIDQIKKMGMGAALAKAKSGTAGAEFTDGARRFYGGKVGGTDTSRTATPAPALKSSGTAASSSSSPAPASKPASSTAASIPNPPTPGALNRRQQQAQKATQARLNAASKSTNPQPFQKMAEDYNTEQAANIAKAKASQAAKNAKSATEKRQQAALRATVKRQGGTGGLTPMIAQLKEQYKNNPTKLNYELSKLQRSVS